MSSFSQRTKRKAFTLVELLVVIGIIALLISILLPALSKAKESANAVACQSNLRQLMLAFIMFADDHKGYLPGGKHDIVPNPNPDPEKADWLLGPNGVNTSAADRQTYGVTRGTIYRYLKNKKVYLCPSSGDVGVYNVGAGSNGYTDYSVFNILPGAKLNKLKQDSYYTYGGKRYTVPTPIIVQEDSACINMNNTEGGHSNTDMISKVHNKGSFYPRRDGSMYNFIRPGRLEANHWIFIAPSGKEISGGPDYTWGTFNKQ